MYARYFSSETCRSFKRNRTSFEVTFSLKPRRKICLYYKDQLWNTSASNARVLSTRWSRGLKRDPPKPNVISDSEAVEFLGDPSDKDDKVSEFMMKTTTGDDVQAFLSKAEEYEKLLRKPGRFLPKRWHVKELLGKGSYGVVYLAEDLENQEAVRAIKVLKKRKSDFNKHIVLWKLKNEVRLLSRLQACPKAIRLREVLEDSDKLFMVMDVCKGRTLQDLLDAQGGRLAEKEAALAMVDVLQFLDACHMLNICYADTKPSNFMFSSEYISLDCRDPASDGLGLKAIDMGCSKEVAPGAVITKRMGTPAYFAPEVFLRSYTTAADLWSAGVLAYQLLTGRFPFWSNLKNLSTEDVMESVVHKKVTFSAEHWHGLSREARDFTASLLRRQAGLRISASEALSHPWIRQNTMD